MAKSESYTGSAVKTCRCDHATQDRIYGKGMRLHTWGLKRRGKGAGFLCTVCLDFKAGNLPDSKDVG